MPSVECPLDLTRFNIQYNIHIMKKSKQAWSDSVSSMAQHLEEKKDQKNLCKFPLTHQFQNLRLSRTTKSHTLTALQHGEIYWPATVSITLLGQNRSSRGAKR